MTTERPTVAIQSGFIPGTLVHAEAGPVPIEQLRVGDRVWSCAEDDPRALQCRPVLNVFVHHDQPVLRVNHKLPAEPNRLMALTCTPLQPFWSEGEGWRPAWRLEGDYVGPSRLRLLDGSVVDMEGTGPVFRTDRPGVGWIGLASRETPGALWDYNARRLVQGSGVPYEWDVWDVPEDDDLSLRTKVHHIEVADVHTCYVGQQGVWVRSAGGP